MKSSKILLTSVMAVATFGSAHALIVDSLTTVGIPGGAGAVFTNIQPGSLFNQRRVQRFNSATAAVGSGAWTATLPTTNSVSAIGYRQDNVGTTIDLTGIASMSFDITVAGSITGYWNLMDSDGYILEVPSGFALSTGTHTVTLDYSTAAIDTGFNLSTVKSMDIWIKAATAQSSFSVSNIRYTPVPEPGTMVALGLGTLSMLRKRRKSA